MCQNYAWSLFFFNFVFCAPKPCIRPTFINTLFFVHQLHHLLPQTYLLCISLGEERIEFVNLRRKRSGPPEKYSRLDILICYWLITAFEETAPDREMHTNLFFTEFCSTFGLDSSDEQSVVLPSVCRAQLNFMKLIYSAHHVVGLQLNEKYLTMKCWLL